MTDPNFVGDTLDTLTSDLSDHILWETDDGGASDARLWQRIRDQLTPLEASLQEAVSTILEVEFATRRR